MVWRSAGAGNAPLAPIHRMRRDKAGVPCCRLLWVGSSAWTICVTLERVSGRVCRKGSGPVIGVDRRDRKEQITSSPAVAMHEARLRMMGQMTAALAHELRQPLGAMSNFIEASIRCLERGGSMARSLEHLKEARDQVMYAGALVARTLDFARQTPSRRTICDLRDIVDRAVMLLRAEAKRHRVSVRVVKPCVPVMVKVDAVQIQQVVCNLLTNAIAAVVRGEPDDRCVTIAIDVDEADRRVNVVVEDTGEGFAASMRPVALRPFHTDGKQGTGLGLWIAHTIVTHHGGELTVTPDRPGKGARVAFYLPLTHAMPEHHR